MKKTIISIIGIAVMLLAITACRPNYVIVPIPGGGTSSTPSGTPVADFKELKDVLANGGEARLTGPMNLDSGALEGLSGTINGDGNTINLQSTTDKGDQAFALILNNGLSLKNVKIDASDIAQTRAAAEPFVILIQGEGSTLENVTITTGEKVAGINVHTATDVTLRNIEFTDRPLKAPINISSSEVTIGGLKAVGSDWYGKQNVIQINGVGGTPAHEPSTVTFESTEGIDAVWREAVAPNYESASEITDADFREAEQTVINGLDSWKVRYSDQPSKNTKGWMFYASDEAATTFTLNADSKVADQAEEDIRAMLTAIAESDSSRKYSVIKLGQNIELDAQLDIEIPVIIDGAGKTISVQKPASSTPVGKKSALFIESSGVTLSNLTVSGPNTKDPGWDEGEYAIKAYYKTETGEQLTNIVLENVTIENANAGMLIRGADVTLNGYIELKNLEWGGISVDSDSASSPNSALRVGDDCKISYEGTGSTKKPAIWIEHGYSNESVAGAEGIGLRKFDGKGSNEKQIWYVTENFSDDTTESGSEEISQ